MRVPRVRLPHLIVTTFLVLCLMLMQQPVHAAAFGQGPFGADIPFGAGTAIDMSFSGDVEFTLSPSGGSFSGQGNNTVTVVSNNPVGYYLFLYAQNSTALVKGSDAIPASANSSPGALALNTWGYNTDGSSNYVGITGTKALIDSVDGEQESGNNTDVYYGVYVDITKPAGDYTQSVTHTLVGKFD